MMDFPLTLTHLLDRARELHRASEIVTRAPDRSIRRATYAEFLGRCGRLAGALSKAGVERGDRVATLMWNHQQHLEAYLAVPAMGAVCHTLNLRLHPGELGYIAKHAGDKVVLVDRSLLPLYEKFRSEVPCIERTIVVDDEYEALIAAESPDFAWPSLDENAAAMICYTSGTTGHPKGVVYSHRSTVLHTLVACMVDTLAVSEHDTLLPVVPMFHAAAWGLPFAAVLAGAKIVMPGPHLDPASIVELLVNEKVTLAAGVPTIWLGLLALLDQQPGKHDLSTVKRMVIGGSACPAAMIDGFQKRHGLRVVHAWGMTETNPLGTVARIKRHLEAGSAEDLLSLKASQGYAVPFVETRHVDDQGRVLPRDASTMGELEVRGPWVAASYLGDEGQERWTDDGWFKTGDVVTLDDEGYMRICDRAKDVIKSGGEWISSVALENALMSHPAVLEAAVFAGEHAKWGERPLAAVVFKPGQSATPDDLRTLLESKFARFWVPDDFIVLEQIPRTSVGKFLKSKLREDHGRRLLGR